MKRAIGLWLVVLVPMLVMAAAAKADPPAAGPAPAPATQPATQPAADVAALIRQLGDDDFHVRLDAERQLKAAGKAAEPALLEARKSEDPEVHARVEEILAELNKPPVDTDPVPQPVRDGNIQRNVFSTRMSVSGAGRTMDVNEPGRTIHLEEKAGTIYLKVTGEIDGKPATREYTAKSIEQLKEQHPAAFELYQQKFGMNRRVGINVGGNVGVNNIRIQVQAGNGAIAIGPAGAQPANIRELIQANMLEARLVGAMHAQGIADAQQQEVRDLIAKLRKAIPDPQKADKEKQAAQVEYERAGDAVRSKIAELKLGDFDNMLPAKPGK